ncbi:hypothetical protein ACLI09_08915 [Flavobacterium sp. RHBU_24]|uniref:hypothetical protein n=1 Tax=Flavobacterium sp. RHBU_24 TaxID=3391185 RepID=UPI0039852AED
MTEKVRTALIAGGLTVTAALFTIIGGIVSGYLTSQSQLELAEQKFNSDLVLKVLESSSSDDRIDALKLLTETNLIKDESVKDGVKRYTMSIDNDTTKIVPQVKATDFTTPIVSNSRIYILAGNQDKKKSFNRCENELLNAGFKVLGSKVISDNGRPDGLEIRYFYAEDKVQAQQLGEVVKYNSSVNQVPVKQYSDANVSPGYIEIWFGR